MYLYNKSKGNRPRDKKRRFRKNTFTSKNIDCNNNEVNDNNDVTSALTIKSHPILQTMNVFE
jgi:hypothetical protein